LGYVCGGLSIVIFIFDLIAVGTGIDVGRQGVGSGLVQGIAAMMLIFSLAYLVLAIVAFFVGVAKNITTTATAVVGVIFSMFVWMFVGMLAPIGGTPTTSPIISEAKASLAFSVLTGVLLLVSHVLLIVMGKEQITISDDTPYANFDAK